MMNAAAGSSRPGNRSASVIYVGGVGRTGSTLIELALGLMPEACPLGEVRHMWQRGVVDNQMCGCGEPFRECAFWSKVGQEAYGGWDLLNVSRVLELEATVDRTRWVPRLLAARDDGVFIKTVREYTSYYQQLYNAARKVSGCDVILDSSKHISFAACLARTPEVDLKIVQVVRHPSGVAHSWSKQVLRPEITTHDAYMPRYSPASSSLQWQSHNALYELLFRTTKVPHVRIRYEDFVADPKGVLSSTADFLGMAAPINWGRLSERILDLDIQHTAAGNPLRFSRGEITIRSDDAWRHTMKPGDQRTALGLSWPLRRGYGYRKNS